MHFEASGDAKRAAEYALQAAGQAAGAWPSIGRSRLYQTALRLMADDSPSRRREVLITLGDAFVNAGLGYEAARSYMAAYEMSRDESQFELRRRAVHQLLVSGHVEEGLVLARQLLAAIGMPIPATRVGTLIMLVLYPPSDWASAGWRSADAPGPPGPSDFVRLDIASHWRSVSASSIRPAARSSRLVRRSWRCGLASPPGSRRALALEAGYRSIGGRSAHRTVMGLLDQARRIATELGDATLQARCTFAEGVIACESADWRRGVERRDLAAQAFRRLPGVRWERVTAQVLGLFALTVWGNGPTTGFAARADGRGTGSAEISTGSQRWRISFTHGISRAMTPRTALAHHLEAASKWTNPRLDIQRFWHTYALCEIDLYRDDGLAACLRVLDVWPKLRKSLLLHVQPLHLFAQYLKGRCAVAAAVAGHVAMLGDSKVRSPSHREAARGLGHAVRPHDPSGHRVRRGPPNRGGSPSRAPPARALSSPTCSHGWQL